MSEGYAALAFRKFDFEFHILSLSFTILNTAIEISGPTLCIGQQHIFYFGAEVLHAIRRYTTIGQLPKKS